MPGVVRTAVGYSGGKTENPDYRRIGDHSETIRIEFDPQQVDYEQLLEVFWASHDPGYEVYSRQYRNAVFYLDESQRKKAEASRESLSESISSGVRTAIEPAGEFYLAEDYHQKYLLRKATGILQDFQAIYPEPEALITSPAAARLNGYLGCNGEPAKLEEEIEQLGLSTQMQTLLVEHVTSSCERFAGLTCPSPK